MLGIGSFPTEMKTSCQATDGIGVPVDAQSQQVVCKRTSNKELRIVNL